MFPSCLIIPQILSSYFKIADTIQFQELSNQPEMDKIDKKTFESNKKPQYAAKKMNNS